MNIHNFWLICIIVRLLLIFTIIRLSKTKIKKLLCLLLFSIGIGFIFKGYYGSNNEIQVAKVFWHETRYVHGFFYLISSIYLFKNNLDMSTLILTIDLIFSFLYRIQTQK